MPPDPIDLPTDPAQPRPFPRTRAWTKAAWSDDWGEVRHLEPLQVVQEAAPGRHQATFRWRAGRMRRPGEPAFADVGPLSVRGQWVKVEYVVPNPAYAGDDPDNDYDAWQLARVLFVGRFAADDAEEGGTDPHPVVDQELTAYGLDHQLDLTPVDGAVVWSEDESSITAVRVHAGVTFNEPNRDPTGEDRTADAESPAAAGTLVGNRSEDVFFDELEDPVLGVVEFHLFRWAGEFRWTTRQAVEHLLRVHYERRYLPTGDRPDLPVLPLSGQLDALEALPAEPIDPAGGSVLEAIHKLIDRRRGLGFTVRYGPQPVWSGGPAPEGGAYGDPPDPAANDRYLTAPAYWLNAQAGQPSLYVFTLAEQNVPLEEEVVLPGNPATLEIDPAPEAGGVEGFRFGKSAAARYGTVVVQGERVVACVTLSVADGTISEGWTAEDQVRYKAAVGPDEELAEANDDFRRDESVSHVYARYVVGSLAAPGGGPFDFLIAGGGAASANVALGDDGELIPDPDDDQRPGFRPWCNAYRVLPRLPLRGPQGLKDGGAAANAPGPEDEFRPPVAFATAEEGGRLFALHVGIPEVIPPAYLRPLANRFGVEIQLPTPHLAAADHFGGAAATAQDPVFSYATLRFTVALETDARLRVTRQIPGGDPWSVLHLEVPGAAFHWVDPAAVMNIAYDAAGAGAYRTFAASGLDPVVRNDARKLRRVADRAAVWFGTDRQTIAYATLAFDDPELLRPEEAPLEVGDLITTTFEGYDPEPVNTPVTQLVFDCQEGRKQVRTRYEELDFS